MGQYDNKLFKVIFSLLLDQTNLQRSCPRSASQESHIFSQWARGFSPLFIAGIFMLLTYTTTLTPWSHSISWEMVKIIYYSYTYCSLTVMQKIRHVTPVSIYPSDPEGKNQTLRKKHLLPLIQNLKSVCMSPHTQLLVHRHHTCRL